MAQASRPAADHISTFPNSDAGPYSADQWAELLGLTHNGDPNTTSERAQLRGVVPSAWNKLVVTNPASVTIRVASGAAWVNGHIFVHDPNDAPTAPLDFTPSTPGANRIDRVVVVVNNTNAAYSTNLEFPTDLTDYAGLNSVPAYTARLALLTGVSGGAMRTLVQTANYWMIEIARYTITNAPAISVGPTDYREFAQILHVVGVHSDNDDTIKDALIIGTEVDDAAAGNDDLGVAILAQLEDDGGTFQDAGRLAARWHTATAGAEVSKWEFRTEYITNEVLSGVIVAPTNAAADGNARGQASVDFQGDRSAATQVASGDWAVVGGGHDNTASGDYSVVGGGDGSTASGTQSVAGGGVGNTASGDYSTVAGGSTNTAGASNYTTVGGGGTNVASGTAATVAGGSSSTASGDYATTAGGNSNDTSGDYSAAGGGQGQDVTGDYACVPGGRFALADKYGQCAHASGEFAANGDAQGTIQMVARCTTAGAGAATVFYLDGAAQRMTIAASSAWTYDILIVGMKQNAAAVHSSRAYGVIYRDNANNTVLASTTGVVVEQAAGCATTVTADNVNEALQISVTDDSGAAPWRWVATIRLAEVMYS